MVETTVVARKLRRLQPCAWGTTLRVFMRYLFQGSGTAHGLRSVRLNAGSDGVFLSARGFSCAISATAQKERVVRTEKYLEPGSRVGELFGSLHIIGLATHDHRVHPVPRSFNRRDLLSASLAAGTSVALTAVSAEARTYSGEIPWTPGDANEPDIVTGQSYKFLTADEVSFLDAAVARLIPADELGPGAKEAGATLFIDRQLNGTYGAAAHWYMQGPWADGEETQGFQSRMTPAQSYRAAIKAIDDYCRKTFNNHAFSALSAGDQDKVLTGLEKGDIKLDAVKAKPFFKMLLQNTIEGFFSDPIYGGNRDMVGWKLIGFPGARYDYRPYVGKHNQKLSFAPVGIKGRPGWDPSNA